MAQTTDIEVLAKAADSYSQQRQPSAVMQTPDTTLELQGPNSAKDHDATEPNPSSPQMAKLTSVKFILTLVSLTLCMFCVALDNNIIVTAVPRITDDFHSVGDIGWYGSAYLLPSCAFQLPSGKLYSRYSAKIVFLTALALFEIGSLICAVAPSSVVFIIGRAISGVGAGAVQSGYLIIISLITPPEKSPVFQSLSGAMFGVSAVVGPLIGGTFTDKVTWRWCFYLNLPVGGVAGFLLILFLKTPIPSAPKLAVGKLLYSFDLLGCCLFLPSIICLIQALEWGGFTHAWSDWRIIVLLVFFAVLLVGFCVDQYFMGDNALIPPRIAKQRTIGATSWFSLFMFGGFIANTYFIPIYFQAVTGATAEASGIRMIPLVAVNVATLIAVGMVVAKTGYYVPFFIACSVVSSVGCGLITTWQVDSSAGVWAGYQIVSGVGSGLAMQLPAVAVQAVLPGQDVSMGIATVLTFQFLGAAVFVSVSNNVLNSKLIRYIGQLNIPGLDAASLVQSGATSIRSSVSAEYLPAVLAAYMKALKWSFRMSLIFSCVSIIGSLGMEWKRIGGSVKEDEMIRTGSSDSAGS